MKLYSKLVIVILVLSLYSICGLAEDSGKGDIESAGDTLAVALPLMAYTTILCSSNEESLVNGDLKKISWEWGSSFALTGGMCLFLKELVEEERPDHSDNESFPSMHTAIAFQSAEFIRIHYGSSLAVPAYFLASFVGYSRIESKHHYFHDVVAGAIMGIGMSDIMEFLVYEKWKKNEGIVSFLVIPFVSHREVGFSAEIRF